MENSGWRWQCRWGLQLKSWTSPHCGWMWQNAKWNSTAPPVQNWPTERACERNDGMSFAVQASLGDSCDVYRPASMTVKGGSSLALFRQELGLSSDSKILLIYDVSTPVFSSTLLTPTDKHPAGRWWHSAKLFVYLLLSPQRIAYPRAACALLRDPHQILLCVFGGKVWVKMINPFEFYYIFTQAFLVNLKSDW